MPNFVADTQTPPPSALCEASLIVCTDCEATVFEWSTPHPDRCWECAETADLEAGR